MVEWIEWKKAEKKTTCRCRGGTLFWVISLHDIHFWLNKNCMKLPVHSSFILALLVMVRGFSSLHFEQSYLFLLNWMAKSVMTLIALLVRVISIWMTPERRAKVPDISSPLAFMAGSQTWGDKNRCFLRYPTTRVTSLCCIFKLIITHCFGRGVGSHRHADSAAEIKQVVQTAANRGVERGRHRSWSSGKTSPHLWVTRQTRYPDTFSVTLYLSKCQRKPHGKMTYSRTSSEIATKLGGEERQTKKTFRRTFVNAE